MIRTTERVELQAQPACHAVEGVRQLLELIVARHLNGSVELLERKALGCGLQTVQRMHVAPDLNVAQQEHDPERQQHDQPERLLEARDRSEQLGLRLAQDEKPARSLKLRAEEEWPSSGQVLVPAALPFELTQRFPAGHCRRTLGEARGNPFRTMQL